MMRILLFALFLAGCTTLLTNREPSPPILPDATVEESEPEAAPQEKPAKPRPVRPAAPTVETVKSMCGPMSQDERKQFIQALDCLLEAEPKKP